MMGDSIIEDVQKSISLFLLMSSDMSGNLITHMKLKGPNVEEWAKAICVSLQEKKKRKDSTPSIHKATGGRLNRYRRLVDGKLHDYLKDIQHHRSNFAFHNLL